ncbi:Hypothetical_protein [Hexamita inflata]|uniref:Hypothetical_protein n=1 Tax=Hexamita inflata TaxID=28002 RepID=A0ABP1I9W6_9EUKA
MEKWNMQEINKLKNTFNQFPRPLTYESKSAENYQNMQWAYICKFKSQMPETRFLPALCPLYILIIFCRFTFVRQGSWEQVKCILKHIYFLRIPFFHLEC